MPVNDIQSHIEKQFDEITITAAFLNARMDVSREAHQASNIKLCEALQTGPARYLLKQSSRYLTILLCPVFDADTDERVTLRKFARATNADSDYVILERNHAKVLGILKNFRNAEISHLIPKLAEQMKDDLVLHEVLDLANDARNLVEKITNRAFSSATWRDECLKFWRSVS